MSNKLRHSREWVVYLPERGTEQYDKLVEEYEQSNSDDYNEITTDEVTKADPDLVANTLENAIVEWIVDRSIWSIAIDGSQSWSDREKQLGISVELVDGNTWGV